jgi:hypothetical protein
MGVTWTGFMTIISLIFYMLAKRYGLSVR